MMIIVRLLFIFAVVSCSIVGANPVDNSASYESVCKYDDMCSRLKNKDGTWVPLKPGLLAVLHELRAPLNDISKTLGVDSRAVAGAVMAENSMNVQVDSDVHAFLEIIKSTEVANDLSKLLRGKSFSLGLGQIKFESAQEAEPLLAKAEHRPVRSDKALKEALLNPVDSIKYAAAITKKCQNDYENNGFTIQNNPAVLATLYNLGDCKKRALAAKNAHVLPRANFFGVFVQHYLDDISAATDISKDTAPSPFSPSALAKGKEGKKLNKPLTLTNIPPQCQTEGSGNAGEYAKTQSLYMGSPTAEAAGPYEIITRGIDCDLKDWDLIRTDDGKMGWISRSVLESNTGTNLSLEKPTCNVKSEESCLKNAGIKFKKLGQTEKGDVEISLIGDSRVPKEVNFRKFSPDCLTGEAGAKHFSSMTGNTNPDPTFISAEAAQAYVGKLNQKKDQITKDLGLEKWDDPQNKFKTRWDQFQISFTASCKEGCLGDTQKINKLLNLDIKKYQGLKGLQQYYADTDYYSTQSIANNNKQALYDNWAHYLDRIDKECTPLIKKNSNSEDLLKRMKDKIKTATSSKSYVNPLPQGDYNDPHTPELCGALAFISNKIKAKEEFNVTEVLGLAHCEKCNMNFEYHPCATCSSGTTIQMKDVLSSIVSPQDVDSLIEANIKQLAQSLGINFFIYDIDCKYDPISTASLIKSLAAQPCVEAVFVPDPYLVKSSADSKKILYKPFSSEDRFSIRLTGECAK